MLGPLPRLYRATVALIALAVFALGGAWAAVMLPYPVLLTSGAAAGLLVGAVCTYLLVHQPESQVARQRARRPHAR